MPCHNSTTNWTYTCILPSGAKLFFAVSTASLFLDFCFIAMKHHYQIRPQQKKEKSLCFFHLTAQFASAGVLQFPLFQGMQNCSSDSSSCLIILRTKMHLIYLLKQCISSMLQALSCLERLIKQTSRSSIFCSIAAMFAMVYSLFQHIYNSQHIFDSLHTLHASQFLSWLTSTEMLLHNIQNN